MDLTTLLGYRRRWQMLSLFSRHVSQSAPIVIGGCHRSGTTLLRVLLGRHPEITAGPESTVFLSRISAPAEIGGLFGFDPSLIESWHQQARTQVEFIEKFQAAVLATAYKPVWAEKTPGNVLRFGFVRRHFPNAWLVHIIRDGRDVICSMRRERWPKPCGKKGSLDELQRCAEYWAHYVVAGKRFAADPRYFELRYEDLVRDPETVLRQLLQFVGLAWSDGILISENRTRGDSEARNRGAIDITGAGKWREELLPPEKEVICEAVGNLLIELGYERDHAWAGASTQSIAHGTASHASVKRWNRIQRIRIEAIAAWRTVSDPRLGWWPRLVAILLAAIWLASPPDAMADRTPVIGAFIDLATIPAALAVAAMLAPTLLKAKRQAVKRLFSETEALRGRPFAPIRGRLSS